MPSKMIVVSCSDKDLEFIDSYAKENCMTRSKFLIRAAREYIDNHPNSKRGKFLFLR